MSLNSVDALCAVVWALDSEMSSLSLRQVLNILEHLDNNGWEVARKPIVRAFTVNDPVPAPPPAEPTQWPPAGISRLWATDMEPDRAAFMEVESIWELRNYAVRGATFIDALNQIDARSTWNDRPHAVRKTFHVNGSTFEYLTDEIPF